jgi:hypothetical protein
MYKTLLTLLLSLVTPHILLSQIVPAEGAELNYRIIGFSFPSIAASDNYRIDIAQGNFTNEDSFQKKVVRSAGSKKNKVIIQVPSFGARYTWRVAIGGSGNATLTYSPLYHFSTAMVPETDTTLTRFRIIDSALAYKDDYVLLDGTKTLYDMKGHPVWFLPQKWEGNGLPVDIKLSPQASVTFLFDGRAYEADYNGDIMWKKPGTISVNPDSQDYFHHDLARLPNGHYMVLGSEALEWEHSQLLPRLQNNHPGPADTSGKFNHLPQHMKTLFGTIVEYDEKGNVCWTWKSSGYFMKSDLNNFIPKIGYNVIDVHENAFYFDEKNQAIYVSFKIIGRVLKIKYPEGKVLNAYGEIYKPGIVQKDNYLFCDQHCCRHSDNGYLYLYNNNSCNDDAMDLPKISAFKEPPAGRSDLQLLWEYQCTADGINLPKQRNVPQKDLRGRPLPKHQTSGGNVIELPDRSMFVAMSGPYCKVFIVSRDKKILWCALPEKYNPDQKEWNPISEYRATIITRQQLERFIWNTGATR